jgi:hypothetical protein
MNSLINQNPLLIISGPNHKVVITKQDEAKINIFFQFEILLNFMIIQYTNTEIPAMSNPTGPFVRVARPIEIPAKRAYLKLLLPVNSLMLFERKTTVMKIKKLNNGSIIPDLK